MDNINPNVEKLLGGDRSAMQIFLFPQNSKVGIKNRDAIHYVSILFAERGTTTKYDFHVRLLSLAELHQKFLQHL